MTYSMHETSRLLAEPAMESDGAVATRAVLSRLGDRWSVLTLHMTDDGPIRFTELKRRIGQIHPISARVLTRTLKQLERDGLVTRKVYPVVPPKVEYRLTRHGERLLRFSREIVDWTREFRADFEVARDAFEARSFRQIRPPAPR
ncbi:winged helix-turn-helix transcriptional regulator [Taklimakanibacter lacteus]|uniref:winged helix-turn-helix transcriptional regulator n=1 Tax=Taklimakanibacter lacteus TaxID=2268456 RepID=UPI0034D5BD27